jgi:fatty acid desaturase
MQTKFSNHGVRNGALLVSAIVVAIALLWVASQQVHPLIRLAAALGFAFTGSTIFSLLHETIHGNFSQLRAVNEAAGVVAASFFPTSFTMQRAFHMTHHRNNRGEEERFDYIAEHENIPLKTAQWYSILTGLYWLSIPIFAVFYAVFAETLPLSALFRRDRDLALQTSAPAFLDSLEKMPRLRIRLEVVFAVALHMCLFWFMGVSLAGWALCYAAFGLMWSSLQYADHAFSALHREEGAWNLIVSRFTRVMFLNYHYHLVHHRNTSIKWSELPANEHAGDTAISFRKILYLMWSGPRLMAQSIDRQTNLQISISIALSLVVAIVFMVAYGGAALLYPQLQPGLDLSTWMDDSIPFIPSFAAIYLTVPLLMMMVPFFNKSPADLLPVATGAVVQIVLASLFFIAMPLMPMLRPTVEISSLNLQLLKAAEFISMQGNYFPSLHVSLSITSAWACARMTSNPVGALMWLWATIIIGSTLLSKQHYLADVLGGALLGLISVSLVIPWLSKTLSEAENEIIERQKEFA